jgi:hypothetical protein
MTGPPIVPGGSPPPNGSPRFSTGAPPQTPPPSNGRRPDAGSDTPRREGFRDPIVGSSAADTMVLAGIFGTAQDTPDLGTLDALIAREAEERAFADDLQHTEALITECDEAYQRERRTRLRLEGESEGWTETRSRLTVDVERLASERAAKLLQLAARQAEYPIRILRRKMEHVFAMGADASKRLLDQETNRFACERELLLIDRERRQLNAPEYKRRADMYEQSRSEAQGRFQEQDKVVRALRRHGITGKSAGFLTWAGYLGFTAFGWFLGGIIRSLHEKAGDPLAGTVAVLVDGLRALSSALGTPLTIGIVVLAYLLIPLLIIGCIFVVDRFVGKFDPDWNRHPDGARGGRDRRDRREDEGFWPWLNNPTRATRRADFAQLIAGLPAAWVALLLPAILVPLFALAPRGAGSSGVGQMAADPWLTVVYTYFGVVVCVALSGLAFIYTTKVIEPRYTGEQEPATAIRSRALHFVRMNFEIALLLGAVIATWIASDVAGGFGRAWSAWGGSSTIGTLLMVLTSAFVVAYGMMFKGILREHVALRNEVQAIERESQLYLALPSIATTDDSVARFRSELSALHQEIASHWAEAAFWRPPPSLAFVPAIEPEPPRRLWDRIRRRQASSGTAGSATIPTLSADAILEPELLLEIHGLDADLAEVRAVIRAIDVTQEEARRRLAGLDEQRLRDQGLWLRNRRNDRIREHADRMARLNRELMVAEAESRTALAIGRSLRTSVNNAFAARDGRTTTTPSDREVPGPTVGGDGPSTQPTGEP